VLGHSGGVDKFTGKDGAALENVTSGANKRRCHIRPSCAVQTGKRRLRKDLSVSPANSGTKIIQAYRAHRPYLIDLAFRMLGDIGEAEDTVQDAFTRLLVANVGEIEDERGWLIVVTSRLCLDRIRSARARRESAHDSAEIEFVAPPAQGRLADPADRVTLDDGVSLALLVMLQRLSPAERVALVLHDIFRMPFPAVAQAVGRTGPACRQLAKRARQKIAESQHGARFDISSAEHRLVTEKFIAACAGGNLDDLLEVLAPDAWGDVDLGPGAPVPAVVHGAAAVARNLLRYWGPKATLVSQPVAGNPAVLGFFGQELSGVLVFTVRDEVIQAVHVIADPRKLAILGLQLPARR
jgi:RNA polymerase sigma-70 factor, ECF subfamily